MKPKVLIIDDCKMTRFLVTRTLRPCQCEILEAVNGAAGLRLARREPPNLILCDVMMPTMDGRETVQRLRETPSLRNVPVIMLTAVDERAQVLDLLRLGVQGYIVKPFEPEHLRTKVLEVFTAQDQAPTRPRVLVADAAAGVYTLVKETLAEEYDCQSVNDGTQCLSLTVKNPPDLLLLDPHLPGMSGLEVAQRLRQFPQTKKLKILALVSAEASVDLPESLFDGQIGKPIDSFFLEDEIQSALEG